MLKPVKASRDFQVFAKPGGAACNLACDYCYYLSKGYLSGGTAMAATPGDLLETYVRQQIEASPVDPIRFSWHGGEPTLLGLEYFRRIVSLQQRLLPPGRSIINGIQTNGTLLDEQWCRFLAAAGFRVGLSLDGPEAIHDRHRLGKNGRPTFHRVMRGFDLLQIYDIPTDILCVVTAQSVQRAQALYSFFKRIGASFVSLLPLVVRQEKRPAAVTADSVGAEDWGKFLCAIFDAWKAHDVGRVQVEIFAQAARSACGQTPSVCIFRPTCGDVPVIERNGDVYSCDHFVTPWHRLGNIREIHLGALLNSGAQQQFGRAKKAQLPAFCRACESVALCNGGCPKNRFITTPDGEPGLNYLCVGYKRFFNHCRPFLTALAAVHRSRDRPKTEAAATKIGRNSPCPCGSGRKYKSCCLAT